jgi:hypothetical protein
MARETDIAAVVGRRYWREVEARVLTITKKRRIHAGLSQAADALAAG